MREGATAARTSRAEDALPEPIDTTQLASLPAPERLALLERIATVGLDHVLEVTDEDQALWLIDSLTHERFQPSRGAFRTIWTGTGYPRVRELARRGLDKLGDPAGRRAKELQTMLERDAIPPASAPLPFEPGRLVSEIFALQPVTSFDRLGSYVAPESLASFTGVAIARWVFHTVVTSRHGPTGDPRWLAAAALVATDERVAEYAKRVLSQAGPTEAREALSRVRARAPAARPAVGVTPAPSQGRYLERYQAGSHEEVWRELRGLALDALAGPAGAEAAAVARETMERVRRNLETIVLRLREHGYKLKTGKKALVPPGASTGKAIDALAKAAGQPVPIALRAFWEIVGAVDLSEGNAVYAEDELFFEQLGKLDPIVVVPPRDALARAKSFNDARERDLPELRSPFVVYVSPDPGAKYDPDGTAFDDDPHRMPLDGPSAEGRVRSRSLGEVPFVDYLRQYLHAGGFHGLRQRVGEDAEWQGLRLLTDGLEPF
jgi:hypothetical protein